MLLFKLILYSAIFIKYSECLETVSTIINFVFGYRQPNVIRDLHREYDFSYSIYIILK